MARIDFQKLIFRFNLVVTGAVFFLLTPAVRIYRSWFPDKKDSLWMLPVGVVLASSLMWLLTSFGMPYLIEKGWVRDRRQEIRPLEASAIQRLLRIGLPVALTTFHLLLVILFSAMLVHFLQREPFENLFTNLL